MSNAAGDKIAETLAQSRARQPLGPLVDARPAKRPERVTLSGRAVTLAPLDADKHAEALFHGANGGDKDRVWTYLADGPYADAAVFKASIAAKAQSADPLFFAVLDNSSGLAVGYQTLMRVDATHRGDRSRQRPLYAGDAAHDRRRPRRNISLRLTSSTNSAIAATSGNATTSTRPRSARRCASASSSKACFASI